MENKVGDPCRFVGKSEGVDVPGKWDGSIVHDDLRPMDVRHAVRAFVDERVDNEEVEFWAVFYPGDEHRIREENVAHARLKINFL